MFRMLASALLAGWVCLAPGALLAQSVPPEAVAPVVEAAVEPVAPVHEPVPTPAPVVVPNGTPIVVEITELVSTRTAQVGDMFPLKLAEPVLVDGKVVIPADTPGKGQVVDTGKPGMGGKPGKLVLAARYLEFEGRQIPIRALKLGMGAKDNAAASIAASAVVSVFGLAVTGGHMEALPGTRASAKLGADFAPSATETAQPAPQ